MANNPAFGGGIVFMSAPPAPGIPEEAVGMPIVSIVAAWFDSDLAAGERALRPLREFGPPLVDLIGPMPYLALQSMVDDGNAPGFRNHWCASYTDSLPASLIADTIAATVAKPSLHVERSSSPRWARRPTRSTRTPPPSRTAAPTGSSTRWRCGAIRLTTPPTATGPAG